MIFYNGLHLEAGWLRIGADGERPATQAVTDAIPRDSCSRPPEFEGNYDPHVWFDVTLWMQATEQIRDRLTSSTRQRGLYRRNADAYLAELASSTPTSSSRRSAFPRSSAC